MENFYENLKKHFENTPVEKLKKQWEEVKDKESIGILIDDLYNQIKTMKNIYKIGKELFITSNEEIKLNDYVTDGYRAYKWKDDSSLLGRKKVIMTTNHDLIVDGVQEIDDDFLNWFVNNQNCEFVKVTKLDYLTNRQYRIYDLPQEEPKQENINLVPVNEFGSEITVNGYGFDKFVKKQQEIIEEVKIYSEEEVLFHLNKLMRMPSSELDKLTDENGEITRKWFNNNKKK